MSSRSTSTGTTDASSQSGSNASGATESSSGASKWSVRALDEKNVTEDNLKKILKGHYEDADEHVQEIFLFVYCDCALNAMGKVPRAAPGVKIKVEDYFKKFPAITCAMIMTMVLNDAEIRNKGQENQGNTPPVVDVLPEERREPTVQKGKGGRPKDVLNFEKGMQGPWEQYTYDEVQNRKASEDSDSDEMTWYKAVVTEMDRKTAAAATNNANAVPAPPQPQGGQASQQVPNQGNDKSAKFTMAFLKELKEINIEEV